jgi:hypothetical protein
MAIEPYTKERQVGTRREKPRKGITARRRAQRARKAVGRKQAIRAEVMDLDGTCRWAGCEVPELGFWGEQEAAHYKAAGRGGDPTLRRYTTANLMRMCKWHHRGPHGLHSGRAKVVLTDAELGTRGPIECYVLERGEGGRWLYVGTSYPRRK